MDIAFRFSVPSISFQISGILMVGKKLITEHGTRSKTIVRYVDVDDPSSTQIEQCALRGGSDLLNSPNQAPHSLHFLHSVFYISFFVSLCLVQLWWRSVSSEHLILRSCKFMYFYRTLDIKWCVGILIRFRYFYTLAATASLHVFCGSFVIFLLFLFLLLSFHNARVLPTWHITLRYKGADAAECTDNRCCRPIWICRFFFVRSLARCYFSPWSHPSFDVSVCSFVLSLMDHKKKKSREREIIATDRRFDFRPFYLFWLCMA